MDEDLVVNHLADTITTHKPRLRMLPRLSKVSMGIIHLRTLPLRLRMDRVVNTTSQDGNPLSMELATITLAMHSAPRLIASLALHQTTTT
jgi:hypothetical protein